MNSIIYCVAAIGVIIYCVATIGVIIYCVATIGFIDLDSVFIIYSLYDMNAYYLYNVYCRIM
jgi:hypothetical protein